MRAVHAVAPYATARRLGSCQVGAQRSVPKLKTFHLNDRAIAFALVAEAHKAKALGPLRPCLCNHLHMVQSISAFCPLYVFFLSFFGIFPVLFQCFC